MAKDINLLPEKENLTTGEEGALALVRNIGVGFLVVVAILAAAVFLYEQVLLAASRERAQRQDNLERMITNLKDREILLRLTKDKTTGIAQVINGRPDYAKVLDDLSSLLPGGMQLLELSVKSNGMVTLSAQADNSSALNTFLSALVSTGNGDAKFRQISVDSLNSDKTGGYRVAITMKAAGQKWLK